MDHKISTYILLSIIILAGAFFVIAADISSPTNLNGHGVRTITNYSSIDGINITAGYGTEFLDIYYNGSDVLFDTATSTVTFTNNIGWENLKDYPVSCPANSYITTLNDSVTCSSINTILQLNVSSNFTMPLNNFPACNAAAEGNMRMNTTSHHPMYCNSTNWVQI